MSKAVRVAGMRAIVDTVSARKSTLTGRWLRRECLEMAGPQLAADGVGPVPESGRSSNLSVSIGQR